MPYCYEYPRPALTTDVVAFAMIEDRAHILLIRRANDPYKDSWAFPGGFVDENEDLDVCALRELEEETGLSGISIEQFYTFGEPGRDPRGHTVSVAYVGIVPISKQTVIAADDAAEAVWFPLDELPPLAFDHDKMARKAVYVLTQKILHDSANTDDQNLDFSLNDLKTTLSSF